jgi:hypothetical protein
MIQKCCFHDTSCEIHGPMHLYSCPTIAQVSDCEVVHAVSESYISSTILSNFQAHVTLSNNLFCNGSDPGGFSSMRIQSYTGEYRVQMSFCFFSIIINQEMTQILQMSLFP